MIDAKHKADIEEYMATIKVGFKCVCSCCKAELPHSDRSATVVTHGLCEPLCQAALDMGYGDYLKPKIGAASAIIASAIVGLAFVSCAHSATIDSKFLDALAIVESNNNPNAIGDNGRSRGAYQIQLAVWQDVNKSRAVDARLPFGTGSSSIRARDFAFSHLTNLHARLVKVGITPTCANVYGAWNLGFTGFKRRGFDISRCPIKTQRAAAKLNQLMK